MVSRNSGHTTEGATKGGSLSGADSAAARDRATDTQLPLPPLQKCVGAEDLVISAALPEIEFEEPELLCCGSIDTNPYLPAEPGDATPAAATPAHAATEPEVWVENSDGMPVWKRLLDIFCVVISSPFWLPLTFLIALWIKAVSTGPLFYWQERVGYRGRRFMILKFRSMNVNADTGGHEQYVAQLIEADSPMIKLDAAGDPRLIRGGRLLRALGFDELPQLLNVLFGEMSLVGPRPCTPHEFARYQDWQRKRCDAPPGLTGYWQVNGKNRTTFSEMIAMDLFYAQNMSLWFDLTIMVRTAPAITAQFLETRQPSWWPRPTVERKTADGATYPDPVQ